MGAEFSPALCADGAPMLEEFGLLEANGDTGETADEVKVGNMALSGLLLFGLKFSPFDGLFEAVWWCDAELMGEEGE